MSDSSPRALMLWNVRRQRGPMLAPWALRAAGVRSSTSDPAPGFSLLGSSVADTFSSMRLQSGAAAHDGGGGTVPRPQPAGSCVWSSHGPLFMNCRKPPSAP